jgi:hypothetical protein
MEKRLTDRVINILHVSAAFCKCTASISSSQHGIRSSGFVEGAKLSHQLGNSYLPVTSKTLSLMASKRGFSGSLPSY